MWTAYATALCPRVFEGFKVARPSADTGFMEKRTDTFSLMGMALALAALIGGSVLKGAGLSALWSPAAFVIVIVGTFAAILLHAPPATFKRAMTISRWVLFPPYSDHAQRVEQIVNWAHTVRRHGVLGLEDEIHQLEDEFLRKGLQLLVDGAMPEMIRQMLEIERDSQEQRDLKAAKVFESMGVYAPTLGIIGAVLGLMAVMKNLSDPSKLGQGIAGAFTATIYGIASANLLFLPICAKLKSIIAHTSDERALIIEGLVAIAQGENPRNIEIRLAGFGE